MGKKVYNLRIGTKLCVKNEIIYPCKKGKYEKYHTFSHYMEYNST